MKKIKTKVASIVQFQDKILLIKEKYWSGSAHKWNIGTGSYETEDGNIINSSIREAKEEAGLDIEVTGFHKIVLAEKEDRIKFYFVFVAKANDDKIILPTKIDQNQLGESIVDFRWARSGEILAMSDEEFVTSTIATIIKEYLQNPKVYPLDIVKFLPREICN